MFLKRSFAATAENSYKLHYEKFYSFFVVVVVTTTDVKIFSRNETDGDNDNDDINMNTILYHRLRCLHHDHLLSHHHCNSNDADDE